MLKIPGIHSNGRKGGGVGAGLAKAVKKVAVGPARSIGKAAGRAGRMTVSGGPAGKLMQDLRRSVGGGWWTSKGMTAAHTD